MFQRFTNFVSGRSRSRSRRCQQPTCSAESLELRILPATFVSAAKLTYQDIDGDDVTVTFSKPILTRGNILSAFKFDFGTALGGNAHKQQMKSINLAGIAGAAGTKITTVAVRNAAHGGDGYAALGQIDATGLDLGAVTIDGDLGRIVAGDAEIATPGVASLNTHSIGVFGLSSGAGNLATMITGKLGSLTTKSDIQQARLEVTDAIGPVNIGGSFVEAYLFSQTTIGVVNISGDIVGGDSDNTGVVTANDKIASVIVGGSVIGGNGSWTGRISSAPVVNIGGDLVGSGPSSGRIEAVKLDDVTIGGSLIGGWAAQCGVISGSEIGSVKVGGDLLATAGQTSAMIEALTQLDSVSVGGSLRGGSQAYSGLIVSQCPVGSINIGGSLIGGSDTSFGLAGTIAVDSVVSLTIGGSLRSGSGKNTNGAILIDYGIGNLTIKGNVIGTAVHPARIAAGGQKSPGSTSDVAIGSLTVNGRLQNALILAGYDRFLQAVNADAQVGPVQVGGNWIASSLIAGVAVGVDGKFGTADDFKISGVGVKDVPTTISCIKSITIGGQAYGTSASGDIFTLAAQEIGSLKIGATLIPLIAGQNNDDLLLGFFADFHLHEI